MSLRGPVKTLTARREASSWDLMRDELRGELRDQVRDEMRD